MLKGYRILLTGLTGQVGGTFADALAPHNEVFGLARFSRPGSREHAEAAGVTTMSPINERDMVNHLEPMFRACSVPATIVNWGGDEAVAIEDMARYMADLIGVEPKFDFTDEGVVPNRITDTSFGRSIGLEWKVKWRGGIRAMIAARHPEIRLTTPA
jgi:nucleoside-diphosphate-sugar epimerase